MGDYESKKNRDYEKYHSDWTSEEFVGKKSINKDDEEFRKSMQNSNFPNYYKILEVSNDATQGEIKNWIISMNLRDIKILVVIFTAFFI